jgi:hypothetical protein
VVDKTSTGFSMHILFVVGNPAAREVRRHAVRDVSVFGCLQAGALWAGYGR